jgi:hypothetical protein
MNRFTSIAVNYVACMSRLVFSSLAQIPVACRGKHRHERPIIVKFYLSETMLEEEAIRHLMEDSFRTIFTAVKLFSPFFPPCQAGR